MTAGAATWFVVFIPAQGLERRAWWLRWLHPAYAHVLACRDAGRDTTRIVDHRGLRLRVETVPMPIGTFLRHLLAPPHPAWILAVEDRAASTDRAALRGPLSCVEAIKALLGCRAPWVLTPRQLAGHLRARMDARPVLPIPEGAPYGRSHQSSPAHGHAAQA